MADAPLSQLARRHPRIARTVLRSATLSKRAFSDVFPNEGNPNAFSALTWVAAKLTAQPIDQGYSS
jgi:hypothetical protein